VKITYYAKYSKLGPSSRYRAFQFLDCFRSAGLDVHISELFGDKYFEILRTADPFRTIEKIPYTLERFNKRRTILQSDQSALTIIEQQLFPYLPFVLEKKYLPSRYLLEFDDAIYLTHPKKFPKMIQHATGVIAGNETLAKYAARFNNNVSVIPTVLNTKTFQPFAKPQRDRIILGWSGLEYNYPYLKLIEPVLQKVLQKPDVELVILSGSPPQKFAAPYRFQKWDPEREVEQLNQFDIGLMPLAIDEWCKGKCGFKLLQYMSLAIPSVATTVGVNQQIIRHGENGFLATDRNQWEEYLQLLIEDALLRSRVGTAARSTVLESYSTAVWFPRLLEIYRRYAA
jgi:glycosyltransferase involved in cell wall biosynthesis